MHGASCRSAHVVAAATARSQLRPCALPALRRARARRSAAQRAAVPCVVSALSPAALRRVASGVVLAASLALARPVHAARPPLPPPVATAAALPRPAVALGCAALAAALAAVVVVARSRAPQPRVVVLGGGFAGLQAALELQRHAHVTLVDRASYFEYTPGVLRALATGTAAPCHRPHARSLRRAKLLRVPADASARISDGQLLLSQTRSSDATGASAPQDLDGLTLPFDFLVVATGSSYPSPIKPDGSESDADARAAALAAAAAELAAAQRVLIIGGGVVGVELAMEVVAHHPRAAVTVADMAPRLLATLSPAASAAATAALSAAGVRLLLGGPLTRTEAAADAAARHVFTSASGEVVAADVVYTCVGARPNSACLSGSLPVDARGYVRVDARWRVEGHRGVYAVGDVAAKPAAQQLGSYAHWEAEFVAADIRRTWHLRGDAAKATAASAPAYQAPPQLVNVSFGPRDGVFLYDGALLLRGMPSALLKAVTQAWFVALLPIPYALLRHLPRLGQHVEDKRGDVAPIAAPHAASA